MLNDMEVLKSKLQGFSKNIASVSELESWISVELHLNAEIQMLRLIFRRKDIKYCKGYSKFD